MKKKDFLKIVANEKKQFCKVVERTDSSITFMVDNVTPRCENLEVATAKDIVRHYLDEAQIASELGDVVASDFGNTPISHIGFDVLYQCILRCFSEHRPLVLTPDAVWLAINQSIAKQINDNAEKYRDKVVRHQGKMELKVESPIDILTQNADWDDIFDDFYEQIDKHTLNGIAPKMVSDFTTTDATSKTASVITLMDALKSYFIYHVTHCICGIPSITLQGTAEDWRKIQQKIEILKEFDLEWWYEYLSPVIGEFVAAAEGQPNLPFWKSIVLRHRPSDFTHEKGGGCIPEWTDVTGWFLVFFPFDDWSQKFESHNKDTAMSSEMSRVSFIYSITKGSDLLSIYPMELWAGLVGVKEDKETFALTPKLGWFVRKSHEEEETIKRLLAQEEETGRIELWVEETGVPDILKKLNHISSLSLLSSEHVEVPTWLDDIKIDNLHVQGKITPQYKEELKHRFKNVTFVDFGDAEDYDD